MSDDFAELSADLIDDASESILQTLPAHDIADSQDVEHALRWVFKNLALDPDGLQDHLIPHPSYRELLRWGKTDPRVVLVWIAKLDEERRAANIAQQEFKDDQRRHFTLFQKVLDYYREHPDEPTS